MAGCGVVRLAHTAGGRGVTGSNPVIPTFLYFCFNEKIISFTYTNNSSVVMYGI